MIGSGYPSDDTTIAFMEAYIGENGRPPPIARTSWETTRQILAVPGRPSSRSFAAGVGVRTIPLTRGVLRRRFPGSSLLCPCPTHHYRMEWLPIIITAVALYAADHADHPAEGVLREQHIMFYGPIMAIKTMSVGFFDRFRKYLHLPPGLRNLRRADGHCHIGGNSTILLVLSLAYTPSRCGLSPRCLPHRNILLIPGLNEYVPSTLAVWLAFRGHDRDPRVQGTASSPVSRISG